MPDIILETRELTREFSGFLAVNGVNLNVRAGTVVDFMAGVHLYAGIAAALVARERTGRGRMVDRRGHIRRDQGRRR